MQFPLSFGGFSQWLAVTAIILLATSELLLPTYGRVDIAIEKKRLRSVALVIGIFFMITFAIKVIETIR